MINEPNKRIAKFEESESSNLPPVVKAEIDPPARVIARIVLTVVGILWAIGIAVGLLYLLSGLILLIVLGIFFAYLVAPLVDLVQTPFTTRNKSFWMPKGLAIGIVYLIIFSVLWSAIAILSPIVNDQITQFSQQAPVYSETIRNRFDELNQRYQRLRISPAVKKQIEDSLAESSKAVGEYATAQIFDRLLGSVLFVPWLVLIPILGFFFLKDAQLFHLAAVRAFPRGRLRGRVELFFQDINQSLAAYIRAQLISCVLIGTICTVAFYIIGVRYALLLGLLAGVLEFIPLVGPLIIGVLATLIASFYSFNQAGAVAVFLLVLRLLQDYVFYPRIIREGIHLHPLAIILAILAGGELGGATGIFLAIPVVAICTVTYRHLLEHHGSRGIVAELLDEGKTDEAVRIAEKKLGQIQAEAKKEERQESLTSET